MGGNLKVVSGGQTGVDRAALDVALELGLPCGGWCPRGRRAEDGPIPARYPLTETISPAYAVRTRWNVRDSDATLVLTRGPLTGGSALTAGLARRLGRPLLVVDLEGPPERGTVLDWVQANQVQTLNVAGPRESLARGIGAQALAWLAPVIAAAAGITPENPSPGRERA